MEPKKSFSFGFKMTKRPASTVRVVNNFRREDEEEEEKPEYVSCINDNVIESDKPKMTKKELVIPLIVNNNWRQKKKENSANKSVNSNNEVNGAQAKEKSEEEKLDDLARKALLKEAEIESESRENRKDIYSTRVIPLLMQNKVPDGFETDERLDVTLRAEESTLSDYEKVPIEEFGLAMLRGMGWKPDEGVGKNAKVVKPVEVKIRPKGLGLGAEIPTSKQSTKNIQKKDEELVLKLSAYVYIEMGDFAGSYGQVEALDDELTRAVIKPAISGPCFTVPAAALRIVSKSEYQKDAKVINKARYDEYKIKSEKRIHSQRKDRHHY